MADVWLLRRFLCPAVLTISAIIFILTFGFDFSVYSDVRLYRNEENVQYSRFERNDASVKLEKRSAENEYPYPKKASSVPEKKQKFVKYSSSSIADVNKVENGKISTTDSNELFPGVTLPPNASAEEEKMHHVYYTSTFYKTRKQSSPFLVDFNNLPKDRIVHHQMLSHSYRRAATVTLSFDFPFYGHLLRNITVATGGFLYMEEYVHSWLAATQYVAPLMANFDTSLKNESVIRYFDNGTAFTVQWHKVFLQDREEDGPFTFQVTLTRSGQIIFVYEKIPLSVTEIANHSHPVKVGISDAYTIDRTIYFIRRKTIYEYNRIDMKSDDITNYTAIMFTALPTCLSFNNCNSCMTADIGFDCVWCEAAQRCSDGLDRYRQDWLIRKCNKKKEEVSCSGNSDFSHLYPLYDNDTARNNTANSSSKEFTVKPITLDSISLPMAEPTAETRYKPYGTGATLRNRKGGHSSARVGERDDVSSVGVGGIIAILVTFGIIVGIGTWIIYAYRYPQTPSGQFLIKYRPSQWRFRHGEARYTAASIHM